MLAYEIMLTGGDADIAVPLVERCRKASPNLRGGGQAALTEAVRSPANRKKLNDPCWIMNALSKKGKLSGAERERRSATGRMTLSGRACREANLHA